MILMSSHLTGYLRNGVHPKPHGNRHPHATNGAFETKDGLVCVGQPFPIFALEARDRFDIFAAFAWGNS